MYINAHIYVQKVMPVWESSGVPVIVTLYDSLLLLKLKLKCKILQIVWWGYWNKQLKETQYDSYAVKDFKTLWKM